MGSPMKNDAGKTENLKDKKEITLRQFRRNKYNYCSITQESNSSRNDTNSIIGFINSNSDKVDKTPSKVDNNEIILISDDEDALGNLKRDVSENMKHIDHEIIELSDDVDPLEIVNDVLNFANQIQTEEYSKEEMVPNYGEFIKSITPNETAKNEDLQSDSEYSCEPCFKKPKLEVSSKQVVEYNNTECSKVELVPNYGECLKPFITNEMLSTNEDLQSNSEYSNEPSFEKPKTEEPTKQVVEHSNNNTEFLRVELVLNYSECLKDLQSNSEYSNMPSSFKKPIPEAPKQDVECTRNNTECSKGELVQNHSECSKTVTTNEMLSKNADLQSNSVNLNSLSFYKSKTDESLKGVQYIKTECSKEQTIKNTSVKNERPVEELLSNNSESAKMIDAIELPTQDLQVKNDNINVPTTQDPDFNNNECLNELTKIDTNEFTSTTLGLDDGDVYRSTEFSKVELVPNYSECSETVTTHVMLSKNEDSVEYNNTECSNEHTIKNTRIKNESPIEELLSNNSECVKMIDIELPTQDLQFKKDNLNVPTTDVDEFLKQDPDFNNNECLNELTKMDTNELMNTTLSLDDYCEGYHSSDFEFIDEDEAKKCPNFLLSLGEAFEKITVNNGHKFKEPQKINVNKRAASVKKGAVNKKRATISNLENEHFSADIEKPATINKANPALDETENINAGSMDLCREDNEMWFDYLQSLQTPSNEQFNKDYRDTHRIPNDEEYLLLFSGLHSPYLMSAYGANKEINYATNMAVPCQEEGFNVNRFVDDSSPEQHQQAKDTEMKIITKYSVENRPRRRRSRRF